MHPILTQFRRLTLYLLAWIPIAGLLAYLLAMPGAITWRESVAMAMPLCLVYAFICLSAWYPCRVTPVERSSFSRLVSTHLSTAILATGVWVVAAKVLALEMSKTGLSHEFDKRFSKEIPLLVGVGVLLYLLSIAFYYLLLALQASQEAEARVMKASVLAREAELRALKAQVNPHFLFNSLNSISALTSSDAAKAREMCILLGDFLRRTLGLGEKAAIPLEEEMSLIRAFLSVEKIRFGPRINLEENIDKEALDVQVPPLLLQPLVENAIVHGIANLIEGGWIHLDAHCKNGEVAIVVENTYDPDAPARRRSGVGLANVRQRLEARFGNRATFAVKTEGDHFRVSMTLPAEREARPA